MADVGADHGANRGDMEIGAHVATYGSIMKLMFYGAIGVAIIAAFVVWIIA